MRFIVYGAGAVGGVIGARLHDSGQDVTFIERGDHLDALKRSGLQVDSPDGTVIVKPPVVAHPREIDFVAGDVVLLAMQTQDTLDALQQLAGAAPVDIPVVCAQNAVENERLALRRFPNVYAMAVQCSTAFLEPGVVRAYSSPTTGIMDVGRFPGSVDSTAEAITTALGGATFDSQATAGVMRWKYQKLLLNLANSVDALCGAAARGGVLGAHAKAEGVECLQAAGIDYASGPEWDLRRGDRLIAGIVNGAPPRHTASG